MLKQIIILMTLGTNACMATQSFAKPNETSKPSKLQGKASYYGRESGRITASGEKFKPSALTAAHMFLPFGTKVRVTNLRNGNNVIVTINDRGPARWTKRIIDLSEGAAKQIDMMHDGVIPILMEIMK